MKKLLTFCILSLCVAGVINGQVTKQSELFIELKKQDSLFFERGFNQCDMEYLNNAIHSELSFFHDQGGMQNREHFFENTRKYICGNTTQKPIRKVDPSSLKVFPLYNNGILYGAIQSGNHQFYIREANKKDMLTGTAKFTHVWLTQNNKWLLRDVLSYDHQPASGVNTNIKN